MTVPRFAATRAALLFVALMVLAGCGERHEWNQRVTVAVETPTGEASGSSVQWVKWIGGGEQTFVQSGPTMAAEKRGEAVVVDLGGVRHLFALLRGDGKSFKGQMEDIAMIAFCTPEDSRPGAKCPTKVEALPTGSSAVLEPDNLPLLVTFDDINDPKSVKLVDPANLAATFGPGFALKSITIEITDEKVSGGKVEKVLGWLGAYPEPPVLPDLKLNDYSAEAQLRHGDFIRR